MSYDPEAEPIYVDCLECGQTYVVYRTWREPAEYQEIPCKKCGKIVWRNSGGRRKDSRTGREYSIRGEYIGSLRYRNREKELVRIDNCDHDYRKEYISGMSTGDFKCTKCGDVATERTGNGS